MTLYSALEQAPVRAGTPGGQSIRDALTFAQHIDGLGFTRLWIAEHHSIAREGDRPHAILGLKVVVGADDEHARALALPWRLGMVRHRAGQPGPMMSVEQALEHRWTDAEREAEHKVRTDADVVGGPETARRLLAEHVARSQADEIIVTTNTFSFADRLASFHRLAAALGLSSAAAAPAKARRARSAA